MTATANLSDVSLLSPVAVKPLTLATADMTSEELEYWHVPI